MIIGSSLIVAAMILFCWLTIIVVRRSLRWLRAGPPQADPRGAGSPCFGPLPPVGPVGSLGQLRPGADITSAGTNERDLYGI